MVFLQVCRLGVSHPPFPSPASLCPGRLIFRHICLPIGRHLQKSKEKEKTKVLFPTSLMWPRRSLSLYRRPQFLWGGLSCGFLLWDARAMPSSGLCMPGGGRGSLLLLSYTEGYCTNFCWIGHPKSCLYLYKQFIKLSSIIQFACTNHFLQDLDWKICTTKHSPRLV